MRIFITERQEKILIKRVLTEMAECDQNLVVFKFLDNNFLRADYTQDVNGKPTQVNTVVWLDKNKQPYKTISIERLFYVLQEEFKTLVGDKKERDTRLRSILNAWINKSYNKETGNILTK